MPAAAKTSPTKPQAYRQIKKLMGLEKKRQALREERDKLIREALDAGIHASVIAYYADLSVARIYQIKDGK